MKQRFDLEIEVDVADRLFSLLGRAVHSILEEHGRRAGLHDYVEQRLFADVDGWRISGGMDLWLEDADTPVITDYKVTTVRSAYAKPEWIRQLNIYAWLFRVNHGRNPTGLQTCVILRDWSKMKVSGNYPPAPIQKVVIPLWTPEQQDRYVRSRVKVHAAARAQDAFDADLPLCTDEERWRREDTYALIKEGGKRATKVYDTREEAEDNMKAGYEIITRPGMPLRCMEFCEAAPFCSQWQSEKDQYE